MALSSARGKLIGVIGDEVKNLKNTGINLHLIFRTLVLVFSLGVLVSLTRTGFKAFPIFSSSLKRKSMFGDLNWSNPGGQTLWWWTRTLQFRTLRWALIDNKTDLITFSISSQDTLKSFIRRDDIDIILINQNVAEMVRPKSNSALIWLEHCSMSLPLEIEHILYRFKLRRCAMSLMPTLPRYLPFLRSQARTGEQIFVTRFKCQQVPVLSLWRNLVMLHSFSSPYDANKDSILRRAKGMFSAEDMK